ncbi:WD40-repeat-containing domain protein [Sporodiniella umbellata]|nr:WD40-repeat-containing domain protein [Sporodiniella umbellata]
MNSSSSLTKFDTGHEDLIHDVSYDFYGKRLVTCSSDQRLKVWDFIEREDSAFWELSDSWKAHDSSILKGRWARPEYGQVIASCSFDRQVKIWEEQTAEPRNSQKRWAERFRLVESRGAVLDLAFAPTPNSLRLATCSTDGVVRVYEALEPTNLAQWSQMEEFEIFSNAYNGILSAAQPAPISQSQGAGSQPSQLQQQFQQLQHQALVQPQSPQYLPQTPTQVNVNPQSTSSSSSSVKSHGLSTPGIPEIPAMTGYLQSTSPGSIAGDPGHRPIDADSGYCIDWCPNRSPLAMMVVGLGKEKGARIFKHDGHNRWLPGELLPGHTQEVHDVSWAPNMARSYQLIATASKDHFVRIFKVTESGVPAQQRGTRLPISPAGTPTQHSVNKALTVELIASLGDHQAEVWRVEWNITGTILSSSGDDGELRLWSAGYDGKWRQMASVTANQHVPS